MSACGLILVVVLITICICDTENVQRNVNWSVGRNNNQLLTASRSPTIAPSIAPTIAPSIPPTAAPTIVPTDFPTYVSTLNPTAVPTTSSMPSEDPTIEPSPRPTTRSPTIKPSKFPTFSPSVVPTPFPVIIASRKPTPLPTFPPTMNYSPTLKPTTSTPFIMVIDQNMVGATNSSFYEISYNSQVFLRAVVSCINTTTVDSTDVIILSVEDSNVDTVTIKYQVSFVAGSIDSSSQFCSAYLSAMTAAVSNDLFNTLLHQYANASSILTTAYSNSVSMEECSNASPPTYNYTYKKEFTLSTVGVIVGVIIVVFGCCMLMALSYYGYKYWRSKIYPYDGMDLDELAAKLEMSEKKEDEEVCDVGSR